MVQRRMNAGEQSYALLVASGEGIDMSTMRGCEFRVPEPNDFHLGDNGNEIACGGDDFSGATTNPGHTNTRPSRQDGEDFPEASRPIGSPENRTP